VTTLKVYKHVPLAFAQSFANGTSIQLGTFESYGTGEGDRVDNLEGIVEYRQDWLEPMHQHLPEFARARKFFGLPEEGFSGNHVIMGGNVVRIKIPQSYIFCCSSEPDYNRCDLGEAIFEITALDLFAHRVAKADFYHLGQFRIGPVRYENRSIDPFSEDLIDAQWPEVDPFAKDIRFQKEREIRVVWTSHNIDNERIQVNAPKVASLIDRLA
jgi:hypothetical protein